MVEKGIFMLIVADPDTSAIIGNGCYWILQPKGTTVPSVVLSVVATNDLYSTSGCTGLREMVLQMDSYASDAYSAAGLSRSLRLLWENYTGNLPDADATQVIASFISKDWMMPYEAGQKGFIYRNLLEFRMHYYDTSLPVSTPSNPYPTLDGGTFTGDDDGNVTESQIDGGTT